MSGQTPEGAASEDRIRRLEMAVERLEALLTQRQAPQPAVADLTADELKAYQKVREVLASDWGDFCGINDCFRCVVRLCRVCDLCIVRPCDVECTCGPCNLGGFRSGGLNRFSGLGG
jgi:hypothetical protein